MERSALKIDSINQAPPRIGGLTSKQQTAQTLQFKHHSPKHSNLFNSSQISQEIQKQSMRSNMIISDIFKTSGKTTATHKYANYLNTSIDFASELANHNQAER